MLVGGVLVAVLGAGSAVPASAAPPAGAASPSPAGTVQVFAGTGVNGPGAGDGGPAPAATFQTARGLAHDRDGNVFVADRGDRRVRRVDARTGLISKVIGRRLRTQPETAGVVSPSEVAVTPAGNLLVLDDDANLLERLPTGQLRVLIGPGSPGAAAALRPHTFAVGPDGRIFFGAYFQHAVLELLPDGAVRTVAGGNGPGDSGDGGPALAARVGPIALAVGPDGALYLTGGGFAAGGETVRRVGTDGIIRTVAGGGRAVGLYVPAPPVCDGQPALGAELGEVRDLTVDPQGRLLIAHATYDRVTRLEADGTLTTLLGRPGSGARPFVSTEPGLPAAASAIDYPQGLDVLPDGRLLVTVQDSRVLAVMPGVAPGVLTVLAGTGERAVAGRAGDRGAACTAQLAYPTSLARAADGGTYVADYLNSQVRRIGPDGRISTVAGTGIPGFSGDGGPGTAAQLDRPRAVALDPQGRLLIADVVNNRVRRLDPATGTITTFAGTGQWGSSGDGRPATSARLAGPHGLAVSPDGTVWVADTGNRRVRRIAPDGTIGTAAGTGAYSVGIGDGGPAVAARFEVPRALAVDGAALYVSDTGTQSVRRVDLVSGRISTLVGPQTGVPIYNPASLLPVPGGLLVADAGRNRIVHVSTTGSSTSAVTPLAGIGVPEAGAGDTVEAPGVAVQVALSEPQGLAADTDGRVLVADTGHHQVLRLTLPHSTPPRS